MPKPATGELVQLAHGWEARIRVGANGERKAFALEAFSADDEQGARVRCTEMAQIAKRLRASGHLAELVQLLEMAAKARGKAWDAVAAAVDALVGRETVKGDVPPVVTFKTFATEWTSGDLARRFPHHVKEKRSAERDEELLRLYVFPVLEDVPLSAVSLDHAEQVMARIPQGRADGTRRHVAQVLRRVLKLAVYPGRHIVASPIPTGWLPSAKSSKAMECLYPAEDRALLACTAIPLVRRLAYGFLCREGMRTDEMASLEWSDVELENGRVDLDRNKTDDPRFWDLDPGVVRALAVWKERFSPEAQPDDRVFAVQGVPLNTNKLAEQLRADLRRAGIVRPQLFERSDVRQPLRAHDLRASFVTVSLATGRTETWISDRTGHRSSGQIQTYRRKARAWSGMNLGGFDPLDSAIPELTEEACQGAELVTLNTRGIALQNTGTGGETGIRSGFRFRRRKA